MSEPFVKWVGGKRQLLDRIIPRVPSITKRYFEPFVGGGSVFLHLASEGSPFHIEYSVINDINRSLINTYLQIRDCPESVMSILRGYDDELISGGKDFYYSQREKFNEKLRREEFDTEMSSLFIFLNKHCFNGVYRVNSKGLFNVPYNNSTSVSFNRDNILKVSESLKKTEIKCGDFEEVCDSCEKGDFIFFDSPYAPLKDTSFESYTKEGFSKDNHLRLCELYKRLTDRGCSCLLTNHNTDFVREIYKDFNIEVVNVKRFVNSDPYNRNGQEVIITNY